MEIQTTKAQKDKAPRIYTGLDAFKLFFAACVVAIHTYALDRVPELAAFWITQGIFRLAVPFFFVASGFMLGRKLYGEGKSPALVLRKYIKNLLPPLLLVGTANGLLEQFLRRLQYGTGLRRAMVDLVKHMIFYPYGAMWYVQACVIGALLLYPFLKRGKHNLALLTGMLLYIWALLCNNYYFLAQSVGLDRCVTRYMDVCISGRNGMFVGFFWLALGIKTYEWHQREGKPRMLTWGLLLSAALYLVEIALLKERTYLDDRALYITQVVLAPALILWGLELELPIAAGASARMRRASTWLYFSHRLIYLAGRIVCFLALAEDWRGPGAFITVLTVSMIGFAAVAVIKRRRKEGVLSNDF